MQLEALTKMPVAHAKSVNLAIARAVVSVSTSLSRDVPTSRLGLISRKTVNVSVIYVSCPRPIFGQIVQAAVRSVNGL